MTLRIVGHLGGSSTTVMRVVTDDGSVRIQRTCEDAEYLESIHYLRGILGPSFCPRAFDDGLEEDVGDVSFSTLMKAEHPRPLSLPLTLRLAHTIVLAWGMLEQRHLAASAQLRRNDVRICDRGVRLLVRPTIRPRLDGGPDDPTVRDTGPSRERFPFLWLAPEAARHDQFHVTSTMFSVGLLLFEALTGRYPFQVEHVNVLGFLQQYLDEGVPRPPASMPAPFARIIERCTRRDPEERYDSWVDLDVALGDACIVHPGDGRPMLRAMPGLRIDARPVTRAEYGRFRNVARPNDEPMTGVRLADAAAYAAWAGKRLPEPDEWERAVLAVGADALGIGDVWELVNETREPGSWVVRGGPWRDRRGRGTANNLSHSEAAPDVGFRCVADG